MRTTLSIDDDVLAAAKELAAKERKSIGEVLSGLAREALTPRKPSRRARNGVPLLPVRAKEHPCVRPKKLRSAQHACPATVALAHRLVAWDETTVREPPIGRRLDPCSRFTPFAISFNRSAA